jgi:hypothetical protein
MLITDTVRLELNAWRTGEQFVSVSGDGDRG